MWVFCFHDLINSTAVQVGPKEYPLKLMQPWWGRIVHCLFQNCHHHIISAETNAAMKVENCNCTYICFELVRKVSWMEETLNKEVANMIEVNQFYLFFFSLSSHHLCLSSTLRLSKFKEAELILEFCFPFFTTLCTTWQQMKDIWLDNLIAKI